MKYDLKISHIDNYFGTRINIFIIKQKFNIFLYTINDIFILKLNLNLVYKRYFLSGAGIVKFPTFDMHLFNLIKLIKINIIYHHSYNKNYIKNIFYKIRKINP